MAGSCRQELNRDLSHLSPVRDLTGRTRSPRLSLAMQVLKLSCTLNEAALGCMYICGYTPVELQSLFMSTCHVLGLQNGDPEGTRDTNGDFQAGSMAEATPWYERQH